MDLQKNAPSRFSIRSISGKDIASPIIEDLIDIVVTPGIHRIILLDIGAAPAGECGGLSDERGEAFICDGVASEIGVKDFEGFGVLIELALRHQLALLRLRLRFFALLDAPDSDGYDGQDGATHYCSFDRPPVAAFTLEPRFA